MKRRLSIALTCALALGAATTSCVKEPETGGKDPAEVRFTGNLAGIKTRVGGANGTEWHADDPVGIYMFKADPDTLADGNVHAHNKHHKAAAGASAAFTPADGTPLYYPSDGGSVKFIAYHPYSDAVRTDYKVPVSVATQTDLSKIDVLYARTPDAYNKTATAPVSLPFVHKLTKLVFNVANGANVTEPVANGVTVSISNQQTTGTLDLANNGMVTALGTAGPLAVTGGATIEAIVLPKTDLTGVGFTFTNKAGQSFTVAVPTGKWEGGYRYTYTVTLKGADKQSDIKGDIDKWEDGGTTPVTGNETAGTEKIAAWANDTGKSLDFTATGDWTATVTEGMTRAGYSDVQWLRLLSGQFDMETYEGPAGAVSLFVELEPNYSGEERQATITITVGGTRKLYHIVQAAGRENGGFHSRPYWRDPDGYEVRLINEYDHERDQVCGRVFAGVIQDGDFGMPPGPGFPDVFYPRFLHGITPGTQVFLRAVPNAGYEFDNTYANNWRVTAGEGESITVQNVWMEPDGGLSYFFEMPEGEVSVMAMFMLKDHSVTVTAGAGGWAAADPSVDVRAGDWVELTATPKIGYEFVEWRSADNTALTFPIDIWDQYDAETRVVMPLRDLNVEAVFAPAPGSQDINDITVTMSPFFGEAAVASLAPSGTGSITLAASDGAPVYLSAVPADGGKFEKWEVDSYVEFADGYGAASNPTAIVMPRANASAVARFVSNGAPMTPAIKFSTQPAAESYMNEQESVILKAEAIVNNGSTPVYQWFRNSTPSYEGATAIQGAVGTGTPVFHTEAENQYWFCVASSSGAEPVKSSIATVIFRSKPGNNLTVMFEKDGIYYRRYDPGVNGDRDGNVYVVNPSIYDDIPGSTTPNWYSGVVNIPSHVTFREIVYDVVGISNHAFEGSTGLTAVNIAEHSKLSDALPGRTYGIDFIDAGAFRNCVNLETLYIPASVRLMDAGIFEGCPKLTLSVSELNEDYLLDQSGALYREGMVWIDFVADIGHHVTFNNLVWLPENFSGLSGSYVIPEEAVKLTNYSIKNVRNLTSLVIPESVNNTLAADFCRNCPRLADLYLNWKTLTSSFATDGFFADTDKSRITLHVPAGTKSLYEAHPLWGQGFKAIVEQ